MRGESMKGKSKKSTYSTTFGVDPKKPYEIDKQPYGIKKGVDRNRTDGEAFAEPCLTTWLPRRNKVCIRAEGADSCKFFFSFCLKSFNFDPKCPFRKRRSQLFCRF